MEEKERKTRVEEETGKKGNNNKRKRKRKYIREKVRRKNKGK